MCRKVKNCQKLAIRIVIKMQKNVCKKVLTKSKKRYIYMNIQNKHMFFEIYKGGTFYG